MRVGQITEPMDVQTASALIDACDANADASAVRLSEGGGDTGCVGSGLVRPRSQVRPASDVARSDCGHCSCHGTATVTVTQNVCEVSPVQVCVPAHQQWCAWITPAEVLWSMAGLQFWPHLVLRIVGAHSQNNAVGDSPLRHGRFDPLSTDLDLDTQTAVHPTIVDLTTSYGGSVSRRHTTTSVGIPVGVDVARAGMARGFRSLHHIIFDIEFRSRGSLMRVVPNIMRCV